MIKCPTRFSFVSYEISTMKQNIRSIRVDLYDCINSRGFIMERTPILDSPITKCLEAEFSGKQVKSREEWSK